MPVFVVYQSAAGIDAIDQHSRHVVSMLARAGIDARYVPSGLPRGGIERGWILLEYQPFSYGRWGFAPGLVEAALRVRRHGGTRLALMVHEAWVPMLDWRSTLMGLWQRAQLRALVGLADCVMTSTQALARTLGDAVHMPIPTNIVPVDSSTGDARVRLGLDDRLTVTLFGRDHESRALGHAHQAIAALARARGADRLTVLNLGADAPVPMVPPGAEVRSPGVLAADELSLHLYASDLVLLPFTDGVSTRRSTLMAALAHGRPILGLRGHNTDSVLARASDALILTPAGDAGAFARAAAALADDPARRQAIAAAGRRLYEERFDWPVFVRRLTALLDASPLDAIDTVPAAA